MARRERDAYYTPALATQVLLARVQGLGEGTLLDPCCGDGRMAEALRHRFDKTITCDVHPAAAAVGNYLPPLDATLGASWEQYRERAGGRLDWVVTNPPFNQAHHIAGLALEHARVGVALLLRCTWLDPAKTRRGLLTSTPPTRVIGMDRISFTGDGSTDSAPAWWMIWHRNPFGVWMRGSIEIVALGEEGQEALL